MPPRVHRATFVPPRIGIARVVIDAQGRIVVPTGLRAAWGDPTLPADVIFTLAGRGYVTVSLAATWPADDERTVIDPVLALAARADPASLPSDHLKKAQEFFRLIACRYLDGQVRKKWQLIVPAPVRAWLGVGHAVKDATQSKEMLGKERREERRSPYSLIAIGTFGALELWSEETLKDVLPVQAANLPALASETLQALRHAVK